MKFTIVTPSLNQGAYIGRTIDSIIRQQGDFEIQYLVRDGGSTDETVEILRRTEELLASRPNLGNRGVEFSWVSERDGGQSAAINAGLRQATGDVLAYLNSDDMYCPGAFGAVARTFEQIPAADFVYGDGQVTDENDQLQWPWLSRPYDFNVLTQHHESWNASSNYISQASVFWRRSVMDRIGYFDEAFHNAMDLEYWVRAGAAGMQLEHIPIELSMFRLIEGTKSLSSPTVFWPDTIEIFRRHAPGRLLSLSAYYFYNLMLAHQWEMPKALAEYRHQTQTTHEIPEPERARYLATMAGGERLGRVVCAIDALRRGDDKLARGLFEEAMSGSRGLRTHPLVWRYRVRSALGPTARNWLERAAQRWVESYRRRKIDYRYQQAHPE